MRRIITVSFGLVLLVGCGGSKIPTAAVSGTVTYNSEAVNGAALLLYPVAEGEGLPVTIPVAQDGTFRESDVPVGEYKVVVEPAKGNKGFTEKELAQMTPEQKAQMKKQIEDSKIPATIKIPSKYLKKETTDLTMKVDKGTQTVPLVLKD